MAMGKPNSLEQFLLLFSAVKEAAGGDPRKLAVFYDKKEALKKAVDNLFLFTDIGDFERRVFHSGKKYKPQAPDGFSKAWKDYNDNWKPALFDCRFPMLRGIQIGFAENGTITNDISLTAVANGSVIAPDLDMDVEVPDPDTDTEFSPLIHDGGSAFEMAFWITESYADDVGSEFEDTIHSASKIGLDAYDYLKNTIGFDASEVFRRWRQLPIIFMPAHVSNRYGLTERGSLY